MKDTTKLTTFKPLKFIAILFLVLVSIGLVTKLVFFPAQEAAREFFIPQWHSSSTQLTYPKSDSKVIAHRGYQNHSVENTLEAIQAAVSFAPAYVEIDIQQTKDNQFVVIHDRTLKRLANKKRKVSSMTLAELEKITLKQNGFTGKIPTLEAAIQLAKKEEQPLLLDIKTNPTDSLAMTQDLVKLLNHYQVADYYLIQSQDEQFLQRIKESQPQLQVGLVINALPAKDFRNFQFLSLKSRIADQGLLEEQLKEKREVFLWTVDQPSEMYQFLERPINGIITDDSNTATNFSKESKKTQLEQSYLERVAQTQRDEAYRQAKLQP